MEKVRKWIEAKRLGLDSHILPSAMTAVVKIKVPKSGYRGVSWVQVCSRWRMRLMHHGVMLASSSHVSKEDAARAYNTALRSALENGIRIKGAEFNVIKADEECTDASSDPTRVINKVAVAPTQRPVPPLAALPPAEVKLMEQHKPSDDVGDVPDLGLGMYNSDGSGDSDFDSDDAEDHDHGGNDRPTR